MRFVKMHGCGNDYLFLDALADPALAERDDLPALTRAMCDRHSGVGADGVIVLSVSEHNGARMRILNADGSDGGMCGNGARCAAKLLVERGYASDAHAISVEISDRIVRMEAEAGSDGIVQRASVDLGSPSFGAEAVGARADAARVSSEGLLTMEGLEVGLVWIGNPHAVAFVDDSVEGFPLARTGPRVEHDAVFPDRINLHVVSGAGTPELAMRSWERGAGETMACGSGACAVCAEGVRRGMLGRRIQIGVRGGTLGVELRAGGHAILSGPAASVFEGEWPD